MFYGRSVGDGRGTQRKSDRYEQMTKQQELIELKKREIQAKAEAEKHKKEMELMLKKANSGATKSTAYHTSHIKSSSSSNKQSYNDDDDDDDDDEDIESNKPSRKPVPRTEDKKPTIVPNVFANDGSFLEQFRRMQEEKKKKDQEEEAKKAAAKIKEEPPEEMNEYGTKPTVSVNKPSIKIINAPVRSSSPVHESNQNVPSPNFYHQNVPPPPPPPPRQDRDQDRLYNRGNTGSTQSSSMVTVPPPPPPPPPQQQQIGGFPSQAVKQLAQQVAFGGEHIEEMARVENQDDPLMWFLYKPNSAEYKRYRELVVQYKNESQNQSFQDNQNTSGTYKMENKRRNNSPSSSSDDDYDDRSKSSSRHSKKRRSRWGPQGDESNPVSPPHSEQNVNYGPTGSATPGLGFPSGTSSPGESSSSNGLNLHPPGTMTMVPPPFPPPPGLAVGHLPPGVNPNFPPPSMSGPPGVAPWAMKEEIPGSSDQKPFAPAGIGNFPLMSSMDFNLKATAPPMLTKVTRQNPQLLAYAQQAYGTINLDEEQWKQCEEAYKMNLIFQDIARKKAKDQKLEQAGKFKHEYDSDEEIDDGGTWEHKQRMKEMEKTRNWASDLTVKAKGKHHIGDFLPPEELAKFMEKYKAVKEGRQLDESDYQEFKIAESNVGFKMLQKMGWSDGEGLGSTGQGITAPIDKGNAVSEKQGLGQDKPGDLNEDDDEYTAYRKRMMLAYRFRPNPLNNPRRAYY